MAVTWQWFGDSIDGSQYSAEGGNVSVHRQLLDGESVQRVIVMGSFFNFQSYSSTGLILPQQPVPFWWHYELSVHYTDTDTELLADRWGVMEMQYLTTSSSKGSTGVFEWWQQPPAMEVDITARKRMHGTDKGLGVTLSCAIEEGQPLRADFQLPDGAWRGQAYMRTLRTTGA